MYILGGVIMREILFKAKRIDNWEWVVGNLIYSEDAEEGWETIIIPTFDSHMFTKGGAKGNLGFENWYRVDKDTICQYTGLTDKNGNKIWENDVVECKNDESHFQSQIEWDKSYCGFILQDSDTSAVGLDAITKCGIYKDVQVIGNIFDNPELLGV